jgi:P4 family phage/plasmid primase-like protien
MTMSKELYSLLKENYVFENNFFTHVSLIQPKGKYSLSRSNLNKFWTLYCKLISNSDEEVNLGIAEIPQNYSSVVVDVDLKFNFEQVPETDRLYTMEFVHSIVKIYQDILGKCLEGIQEDDLLCVLLEKPIYNLPENCCMYKNGFHLHFPNVFISKVDHEINIIPRVKQALIENSHGAIDNFTIFSQNIINVPSIEKIIDTSVTRNAWLLYGSKKSESQNAYSVSKIYDTNLDELDIVQAFKNCCIYDEEEEQIELNENNIEFHIPRILSICPYGRNTFRCISGLSTDGNLLQYVSKPIFNSKEDSREEEEVSKDLEEAKKIIKFLHKNRADDRNDWMIIGWLLFNISQGSDEGLDIWLKFSSQSEKFNEATCIYEWSNMVNKGKLTLGTLKYFAKQDDPEGYQKYLCEKAKSYMKKELKTSHYDLAQLLYNQYSNEFVYCESGWYRFLNHHWQPIDRGTELRQKISKDLVDFFGSMRSDLYLELSKAEESERKELEQKNKDIARLIGLLKSTPFKSNIMRECEEIFHIRDFEKKLNTNRYLIGFTNGVFDLENNVFRNGIPTDYISVQMAIAYKVYTPDDPKVLEVHNFLEKVFPDTSLRRYFTDVMSEIFVGYNHRKNVYFWTGEGNNAKSITQMFFEKMLGRLSIKAPTTLITSKRQQSGSANAELARAGNGVRTIFMEEPDQDEEINPGVFKQLSGNDSIYNRDLFQKGKDVSEIIPMFKPFVICNKLPKVKKGGDPATWNRIRVIPFEATFSKNAPPTLEEQLQRKIFPIDPNFAHKIPELVDAFAWLLLEHRVGPKIDEPEKVIAATDKYKMDNDYYHQFCAQYITDDPEGSISVGDMYHRYKEWLEEGVPGVKHPTLMDFTEYYQRKWGDPDENDRWYGKRFKFDKAAAQNQQANNPLA